MNKKDLRKLYSERRMKLVPGEVKNLTDGILAQFSQFSLSDIKLVHLFYPIAGKQEFNSLLLKEHILQNHPEIQFALPKSDLETHRFKNILWDEHTALAMNQWGITEPEHGPELSPITFDIVIVPLLAFDEQGNRVGFGKGFYDRFLSECRTDTLKIGISYFEACDIIEDADRHDVPLDICFSPSRTYRFNRPNYKA